MARLSMRSVIIVIVWVTCLSCIWIYYPVGMYGSTVMPSNDTQLAEVVSLHRLALKLNFTAQQLVQKEQEISHLQRQLEELRLKQLTYSISKHFNDSVSNTTAAFLNIPNIFRLMPHLNYDLKTLQPCKTFGKVKRNAELVMAVPHVHRTKQDYLIPTLKSLIGAMTIRDKESSVIVVMVAEPWNEKFFEDVTKSVQSNFAEELISELIEVILPPAAWYPDLDHLPEKWGDKPDRARWRTKQNLDYAFMMLYCSNIGRLYVQLEDDISVKPGYIDSMKSYAESQDRWELLEFSQLGFIGKMFRSSMLPKFVEFILMFYQHKPVDWLLDNYFWVQECFGKNCPDLLKVRKRFRPSLFQHEGYHSSLDGKVQKLKDKDFDKKVSGQTVDPVVHSHANPPARLETSLKQYQKFSLDNVYAGKTVFWALNPQPNDHIVFTFTPPLKLKRYRVVSGDSQHKDDRLTNATIEFKPVKSGLQVPHDAFVYDTSGFIALQYFNRSASASDDDTTKYSIADGKIPDVLGAIEAARIMCHSESQSWVIINELWFES